MLNVILLRGLAGNIYSTGLDDLARELNKLNNVDYVVVSPYTDWRQWAQRIAKWKDPTVLVGHSYGVAGICGIARTSGVQVPLLVSFDPSQYSWMALSLWGSGGNTVPNNVGLAYNFYQDSGLIGRQVLLRDDMDVSKVHNTLIENTSHGNIEDIDELQVKVIKLIRDLSDNGPE